MFGTDFYNSLKSFNKEDMSAKDIYDYLDKRIIKQEEAKKAAAMIMWKCLRGIKENAIFCGPTGCGKTEIWRCLSNLFPNSIHIVDASSVTKEGFTGNTKWKDLLKNRIFKEGEKNTILVLDEIDKLISPQFTSSGENISESIMNEGLKLIEGTVTDGIDTRKISFVMLGAFSRKAGEIAEKSKSSGMGFGAVRKDFAVYSKPLTITDIISFGATPEFMGRVGRIVNLSPMSKEDYENIFYDEDYSPLKKFENLYNIRIYISSENRERIIENAVTNGLGIRGISNEISNLVDERLFEDPERECILI